MTPSNIDRNIVEMRFDNAQFESNVKESLKTIAKLKQELEFGDVSKGFDELEKTGKHFSANFVVDMRDVGNSVDEVGNKFSALQVMGVTALANLTNQAVNYGKKIAKALTIEPVMAGKGKYESYLRSVQTMLFQDDTLSESAVAGAMDNVLEYVDQTSYGFAELTKLISQFTSYGIELEKAEKMAEGVGNWGGLSGKNVNELGVAFYNIPQMIAAGAVKQMDWKSINLTGMAIKQFKELVIDMAIESGRLIQTGEHAGRTAKGTEVNFQSFDQTLRECWFDADLLSDVLVKMSDRTEGLGKKGFLASQRALGLADALNAIKDAASTGWLNSFTLIFGMVDGAARIFTDFADAVMTVISLDAEFRNSILGKWLNTGEIWDDRNDRDNFLIGRFDVNRDRMRDTASNLWYGFTEIKKAIENGLDISFTGVGRHFGDDEANYVAEQYALFLGNVTDKINAASLKFRSWLTGEAYTQEEYVIEGIDDVIPEFDEAGYTKSITDFMKNFYGDKKVQQAINRYNKSHSFKPGESGFLSHNYSSKNDYEAVRSVYSAIINDPQIKDYLANNFYLPTKEDFTKYLNDAGNVRKEVEESGKDVQLFGYFWRDWTKVVADGKTPLESITDLFASLGNVLQIVGKAIRVVSAPVTSFLNRIMRPGGVVSTILSDISTSLLWITDTVKNSGVLDILEVFFDNFGGFLGFLLESGFFSVRDIIKQIFVGAPQAIRDGLDTLNTFFFGAEEGWKDYETKTGVIAKTYSKERKGGVFNKIADWIKKGWNKVKNPLKVFTISLGSSFTNLGEALKQVFGMDTSNVEGGFYERLMARLKPLGDYFANLWPNFRHTFITELEKINPELAAKLRKFYTETKANLESKWNKLKSTVTSIFNGTFDWEEAKNTLLGRLSSFKTWLTQKLSGLGEWFEGALESISPDLRDAWMKFLQFFGWTSKTKNKETGEWIETDLSGALGIKSPFLQKIDEFVEALNKKFPFLEQAFNKLKVLLFGEDREAYPGAKIKVHKNGWVDTIREWASGAWDWFSVPEVSGEGEEGQKKTGFQMFIDNISAWIHTQLYGEDENGGIIGKFKAFKTKVEKFVQPVINWFTVPNADNKTGFQIFLDGVVSWFEALPGRIGTAVETVKQAFHNAKVWLFGEDITTDVIQGQEKRVKGGKYLTPDVLVTTHKNGFFDNLGELGQKAKELFGEGAENYSKWKTEDGSIFGFLRFVWEEVSNIGTLFQSENGGTGWFDSIKEFFGKISELFHGKKAEEAKDAASDAKESAGEVGGIVNDLRETTQQISDALGNNGFNFWTILSPIGVAGAEGINETVQQSIDEAKKTVTSNPQYQKRYGIFGTLKAWFDKVHDGAKNLSVDLNYQRPSWMNVIRDLAEVIDLLATAYVKFNLGGAIRRLTGGVSLNKMFGNRGLKGILFGEHSIWEDLLLLGIAVALVVNSIISLDKEFGGLDSEQATEKLNRVVWIITTVFTKILTVIGLVMAGNLLDTIEDTVAKGILTGGDKEALKSLQKVDFNKTNWGMVMLGMAAVIWSVTQLINSIDISDPNIDEKIQKTTDLLTSITLSILAIFAGKEGLGLLSDAAKKKWGLNGSSGEKLFSGIDSIGNTVLKLGVGLAALMWGINAILDLYNRIREDAAVLDENGNPTGETDWWTVIGEIGTILGGIVTAVVTAWAMSKLDKRDPTSIKDAGNGLSDLLKTIAIDKLIDSATNFLDKIGNRDVGDVAIALITLSIFLAAASLAMWALSKINLPSESAKQKLAKFGKVLEGEGLAAIIIALAGVVLDLLGWATEELAKNGHDPVEKINSAADLLYAIGNAIGSLFGGLFAGIFGLSKANTTSTDDALEMLKKIEDSGLDVEKITPVLDLLSRLADIQDKLPNIGGIRSWFMGNKESLPGLAEDLSKFVHLMADSFSKNSIEENDLAVIEQIPWDAFDPVLEFLEKFAKVSAMFAIAKNNYSDVSGAHGLFSGFLSDALDNMTGDEVKTKLAEFLDATKGGPNDPLQTQLKVNIVFDMDEQSRIAWSELYDTLLSPTGATSRVALKFEQSNQIDYSDYLSSIESKLDILGADMANLKIYINSHALVGQIAPELSRRFAQQYAMVGGRP